MRILILFVVTFVGLSLNFNQFQQTIININTSPMVNLLMIYDSNNEKGPIIEFMMKQIAKKREGYFKINFIDCDKADEQLKKGFEYCSQEIRQKLPALMFSKPTLNLINPQTSKLEQVQQVQYQGALDEKSLYEFAVPLMRTYSQLIKRESELKKLKDKYPKTTLIVHCTNKKEVSAFYKALTANFRNRILFAHILPDNNGNNILCEKMGVKKYPTLLLNGQQEIKLSTNLSEQIKIMKQYQSEYTQIFIPQKYEVVLNELTIDKLDSLVYKVQKYIFINIRDKQGNNHPQWDNVQVKFKKMFEYYEGEGQQLQKQLGVKKTPAIVYFPQSLVKKSIQKVIFYQHHTYHDIQQQIRQLIEDFTVPLTNDLQLQQFTSLAMSQNKLVTLLFHNEEIPLAYKMLSNHQRYKQTMTFFRMKDPQKSIKQRFKIKQFPFLIVMINDQSEQPQNKQEIQKLKEQGKKPMNLKIAQYTGKFIYDELYAYLSYFGKKQETVQQKPTKQPTQIKSSKQFKKLCIDSYCYLLLINGHAANKDKNVNFINQFKKIGNLIGPSQSLGILDGVCHSQIIQSLQILEDQLPTVVYINPKIQKFGRLVGRVEQSYLKNLVGKVRSNKLQYRAFSNLQYQNKQCEEIYKKNQQRQSAKKQSQLSPQQAAILEQIKKEQQLKKKRIEQEAQAQAKEQSPKRKKKRRPKRQWEDDEL